MGLRLPFLFFLNKIFGSYLARRLLQYFITLYIVFTIDFIIPRLIPGEPILVFLDGLDQQGYMIIGAKEELNFYKQKFGLNGSLLDQYIAYIVNLSQGDLGISLTAFPKSVSSIIAEAVPWSIGLLSTSLIISWVAGNLLGVLLALSKKKTAANSMVTYMMLFVHQIPFYVLAIILLYLFAYLLPIFPLAGTHEYTIIPSLNWQYIISLIRHSTLPVLSLLIASLGGWMITMRSNVLNILGEEYLMLAKAKGLRESTIRNKYVFRNALLPQATGLAISLGQVVSGSLLVENLFAYPGLGYYLNFAVSNLDYNLMQGILTVTMFVTLTAALLVDLLYPLIDPRIRYKGK